MKVALISDTHGIHLPAIEPDTDFIIHAGDICPDTFHGGGKREAQPKSQHDWFEDEFRKWHTDNGKIPLYGCWGNHDFVGETVPNVDHDGIKIITDKQIDLEGLKTWFTPRISKINGVWAFECSQTELEAYAQNIPDDTQVIISHGPPRGMGDLVLSQHITIGGFADNVGSSPLLRRMSQLKDLRLVVCGHIHEGRGLYANELLKAPVLNVAVVDRNYKPVHNPVVYIDWPTDRKDDSDGYGHGV